MRTQDEQKENKYSFQLHSPGSSDSWVSTSVISSVAGNNRSGVAVEFFNTSTTVTVMLLMAVIIS